MPPPSQERIFFGARGLDAFDDGQGHECPFRGGRLPEFAGVEPDHLAGAFSRLPRTMCFGAARPVTATAVPQAYQVLRCHAEGQGARAAATGCSAFKALIGRPSPSVGNRPEHTSGMTRLTVRGWSRTAKKRRARPRCRPSGQDGLLDEIGFREQRQELHRHSEGGAASVKSRCHPRRPG